MDFKQQFCCVQRSIQSPIADPKKKTTAYVQFTIEVFQVAPKVILNGIPKEFTDELVFTMTKYRKSLRGN